MGLAAGLLVGFVAISKELLVFNEETVVAVSTTLTVFLLVKYAGGNVTESLDEQAKSVASLMDQARALERSALTSLQAFYKTEALAAHDLAGGADRLATTIQSFLASRAAHAHSELSAALETKFQQLAEREHQALEAFQKSCLAAYDARIQSVVDQGTPLEGMDAYASSEAAGMVGTFSADSVFDGAEGSSLKNLLDGYSAELATASARTDAFWSELQTSDILGQGDAVVYTGVAPSRPAGLTPEVAQLANVLAHAPANLTVWSVDGTADAASEGTDLFEIVRGSTTPTYELLGSAEALLADDSFEWHSSVTGPVEFYLPNDFYGAGKGA